MKGLLFFGALALLAFVSCKDIDVPYVPEETHDEAWYADNATISSSDTPFSITEEGEGTISFKAEGGSVVVYVDCGTEWTADDSGAGVFGCDVQETCITVTAEQNLAEEELCGIITLMTLPSQIHFATIAVTQNAYGAPEITVEANEWNIPAVAATAEELTTEIGVEATGEWEVESDAEWLTAEKGGDGGDCVILTAAENETFEERVAEVVLTCTDGYNSDSETITVTQDGAAFITLSNEKFEFSGFGGKTTVSVESNFDWEYDTNGADWLTVTDNGDNSVSIVCSDNDTGSARETSVTFTAGDGAANDTETTLTIAQGIKNPDDLVLEYTITSDGTRIQLPMSKGNGFTIDCTVDWGDGEAESVSSDYPTHTYSEQGTYIVTINGTVERLYSNDDDRGGTIYGAECLTSVKQWGDTGLRRMASAFTGCSNLTSLPEGPGPFENVTTFDYAFNRCQSLKRVPEGLFKNCTECTTFIYAFLNCTSLTSAPSFEGLSKATIFNGIFSSCTSLVTVPENMFSGCTAVTNFTQAFYNCSSVVGESPYDEINVEGTPVKVHLYERENYPDYFTAPTSHTQCFRYSSFSDYDDLPSGWK